MLSLAGVDDYHMDTVDSCEEKVRNVFYLGVSLTKYFKKLEYTKREELFEEQFRCMKKWLDLAGLDFVLIFYLLFLLFFVLFSSVCTYVLDTWQ